MREIDIERALLGRPARMKETRSMPLTQAELHTMQAQQKQAMVLAEHLPRITEALERIATALEADISPELHEFMTALEARKETSHE